MKGNKSAQTKWYVLILIALIFFLIGMNTGNYIFNLVTIILAFIVYKNGYKELFGNYDRKQKEKREKAEQIYSALRNQKIN